MALNNVIEHHWEDESTAAAARHDDSHCKAPPSPEVMSNHTNSWEEEESESDACANALREEDLIVLVWLGEREHEVGKDVEERGAWHHKVEMACVKEFSSYDTHSELEEELD